jgi:hypothetical protein
VCDIICAGTRLCVGGMLEEIYFARKILDAQLRDRGMVLRRRSPSLETLCVQITLVVDAWQLVPHDPEQMVLGTMMSRCCPAITTAKQDGDSSSRRSCYNVAEPNGGSDASFTFLYIWGACQALKLMLQQGFEVNTSAQCIVALHSNLLWISAGLK